MFPSARVRLNHRISCVSIQQVPEWTPSWRPLVASSLTQKLSRYHSDPPVQIYSVKAIVRLIKLFFLTTGLIEIQAGGALPCTWRVFYRSLASFRWHRAAVPQVRCSHHSSVVITSVPKLRQITVMLWFMPTGMAVCYSSILWRQLEGLLSSWTSKV